MAKIKLNVDALRVETFDTAPVPAERGTVHGRQLVGTFMCVSAQETCAGDYCTRETLCLASCQMQCYASVENGPEIVG